MDDFGDKLNAILSDPAALSRISELAKSVMGGEKEEQGSGNSEPDAGLMTRLAGLMSRSSARRAGIAAAEFGLGEKGEGDV